MLLSAAVAITLLVMARETADEPQPARPHDEAAQEGGEAALKARGERPVEPDEPEAPASDPFLKDWDAAEGVPMGNDELKGIVVDVTGAPVPYASVWLRAKPGQPKAIDSAWAWKADADGEGRWTLRHTWATRSTLGAWAEGFDPAFVEDLSAEREIRVVLEKSPTMVVVIRPPDLGPQTSVSVSGLRIRIRLVDANGVEHPAPGQALAREWDQRAELDKPTEIPVPRGQHAHVTAGAFEWACTPAFQRYPAAAKELEFTLVPTSEIYVRLLDAETGDEVKMQGDGSGYWAARHVESGFQADSYGPGRFTAWVPVGEYDIELRYRGYTTPPVKPRVRVERPGQRLRLDIKLARDRTVGTLHVDARYAADSQLAEAAVETGGLLLARRRESKDPRWRRIAFMSGRHGRLGERHTAEKLTPGTYDLLVWDGLDTLPKVGIVKGVKLAGGDELVVKVELRGGWGYRPSDVLKREGEELVTVRAEAPGLGVLPWVTINASVYIVDEKGFVETDLAGYIGQFPFGEITLVKRAPDGTLTKHPLKPAISPSKR